MSGLVFKLQHKANEKPEYYLKRIRQNYEKKWHFVQNKTGIMQNALNMQ
jgi:hypothetical protein